MLKVCTVPFLDFYLSIFSEKVFNVSTAYVQYFFDRVILYTLNFEYIIEYSDNISQNHLII